MQQMQFQTVQKNSDILSIRPPELGTSNVFSTRSERSSFPPRSRRQWRCRRKPNTANVRRSCRSEGDQQNNKIATVSSRSRRTGSIEAEAHREINKHVSDDVRAENKPKTAKIKEAKDFNKSEAELVDAMDTFQHGISIIEKEMAKNPIFGIDTRNTNNATEALITKEDFNVKCQ